MSDAARQRRLHDWADHAIAELGARRQGRPAPLQADASFRRFERIATTRGSLVLMDAPPAQEKNAEFVAIARWLQEQALPAPRVLAVDLDAGFLLVTDLGETSFADALDGAAAEERRALYARAIELLHRFQTCAERSNPPFADYNIERLNLENELFATWFIGGLLQIDVPQPLLQPVLEQLTHEHLAAPRAGVHLDWHCRNLMVTTGGGLALVDFQDARFGPRAYDLVSLLRDCYQDLPDAEIEHHLQAWMADRGIRSEAERAAFRREFDLVGLQRHLKCLGIFARLHLRDSRSHALGDLPRVLQHVLGVTARHDELAGFDAWLRRAVAPALDAFLARHVADAGP